MKIVADNQVKRMRRKPSLGQLVMELELFIIYASVTYKAVKYKFSRRTFCVTPTYLSRTFRNYTGII